VFEDNSLMAIFPLSIIKISVVKVLCFIGFKFADYCYPIINKKYDIKKINTKHIFENIYKEFKFDNVIIKNQKELFFNKKNIFFDNENYKDRYKEDLSYKININSTWEDYLDIRKKKIIKKLDKSIKRRLGENFEFKINSFDLTNIEKIKIVNFLITKKRDQLNRTKIFHYLNNSKYENFLKEIFINNNDNFVSYSYIKSNNSLIAVHIGFLHSNNFYYLFPVYDYQFKQVAAGKFVISKLIRNSFENGYSSFDFTTGGEVYKQDWSNDKTILYSFIKNYSLLGRIFKLTYLFYKFLIKKLD
jgi:CelD/BcsL family acetyltransferase involved in cellulose biosynthesis